MILYKCDRCGKIQEKQFRNSVEITVEEEPQYFSKRYRMFCDKCAEDLVDWFIAYQKDGE